ncbi:MAG: helix-turn-helix transcriptional regulator [Spirochaetales bacterium]|nr:helix-turn-helix transcriptional regulator [Spirochaetales bacterium]
MVTKGERKLILDAVGNEIITDRIVEYLNRNKDNVGYEVFKDEEGNLDKQIFKCMFRENWTKERFIQYLPFFYYSDEDEIIQDSDSDEIGIWTPEKSFAGILEIVKSQWVVENCYPGSEEKDFAPNYEELKEELAITSSTLQYLYELLVLKTGNTCKEVVDFIFDNCMFDSFSFDFDDWIHYLRLCEKEGKEDWFPDDLGYNLRMMQELAGEKVDLIYPSRFDREGTKLVFHFFHIPRDMEGKPVMKWLGIRFEGNEEIYLDNEDEDHWISPDTEILIIRSLPDTRVWEHDRNNDEWKVIYTGPRNVNVDFSVIKKKRNELKLTQTEVSEAIDVSTRTYQKWEKGDMKGISGFFLLRLMKYLNISLDEITKDEGK